MVQISTLKELESEGKKVAFIKGNRETSRKNIKQKEESFDRFETNIIPLMYVSGNKAIEDGCSLIDLDTKEEIVDDAANYIAIIDGQHRYTAAKQKELDHSKLYLFESYCDKNTKELLAAANTDTCTWNTANYANAAQLFNPSNQLAKFINKLAELKYPISTIGLILYFDKGKLTRSNLSKLMHGENITGGYNLDRANSFLQSARKKFDDKFIAKRYLISVVITLSAGDRTYKDVCSAIEKISEDDVNKILESITDEKEQKINEVLSKQI
jgi:hypothetical protein